MKRCFEEYMDAVRVKVLVMMKGFGIRFSDDEGFWY